MDAGVVIRLLQELVRLDEFAAKSVTGSDEVGGHNI